MPTRRSAERLGKPAIAVLLLAARGAPSATPQQVGASVKACGQVINVSCHTATGAVSWLLDLGAPDVLLVRTHAVPEPSMVRELALRYGFGRLCVAGRLLRKSGPFEPAVLAVEAARDITLEGEPVPDPLGPDVFRTCDAGVQLPTVVKEQRPNYTSQALSAGVRGTVWVEAVVGVDGKVSKARVVRSLDRRTGLDAQAVAAAKRWRFKPGTKDGRPVAVAVIIELTFNIKPR